MEPAPTFSRLQWLILAAFYAALVFYASTALSIVGYAPAHFDWAEGWRRFLLVRYIEHGSDQRADWTANLLMIVPLGFMLTAGLWPRYARWWRIGAALAALCLTISYVVAVKFVQLWFPRTVTINYITAQSIGAAIGVLAYGFGHARLGLAVHHLRFGGRSGLIVTLSLASIAAFAFTLVPFDIVVSSQDVAERLARLPQALFVVPGTGRSTALRLVLLLGAMGLAVPMGMLLEAIRPGRSSFLIAVTASVAMTAMLIPSLFVISTNPALVTIPLHVIGFCAGAWLMRWLGRQDVAAGRPWVKRAAWISIPFYLGVVAVIKGLAGTDWRALDVALADRFDPRRLLPLWTYYNISKAQAVLSLVTHLALYAPVGMLLWAIAGSGRGRAWQAALLGLMLSAAMEAARGFGPGFSLDVNNLAVGAIAAGLGMMLARFLWSLLEDLTRDRKTQPRRGLGRYL